MHVEVRGSVPQQERGAQVQDHRNFLNSNHEHDWRDAPNVLTRRPGASPGPRLVRGGEGLRVRGHTRHGLHARAAGLLRRPHVGVLAGTPVAQVPLHHVRRHALRCFHPHGGLVFD